MGRRLLPLACVLAATGACNDPSLVDAPLAGCESPASSTGSAITAEAGSDGNPGGGAPAARPRIPRRTPGTAYAQPATSSFAGVSAADLLAAMDATGAAEATLAGHPDSVAVFPGLGAIEPVRGSTFAWLSTGIAGAGTPSAVADAIWGTQDGTDMQTGGCAGAETFDCVELRYAFDVPEGMHAVRFDFNFLSTEYPEYIDAGYNDTFVVSLESESRNYANIVFDENENPIGIDSAFFDEPCTALDGTGFDLDDFGFCDAGATGILTTVAPVEPGERVTLTFRLMDAGDGIYDSAVMIDNLSASGDEVEAPETNDCE